MKQSKLSLTSLISTIALASAAFPTLTIAHTEQKETIEQLCSTCHSTSKLARSSGYSQAYWKALVSYMVDLNSNGSHTGSLSEFLADKHPENNKRMSTVIEGDLKRKFTCWQVPTLGQRARDPVQGDDGINWWVGQWGNILGRLDRVSGKMNSCLHIGVT